MNWQDTLKKADELMSEIMEIHADPNCAEYNDCDKKGEECMWCVQAAEVIDTIRLVRDNHD